MSRQMRIGDLERERAASSLAEHFAQGRLSHDEYSERFDAIWTARTRGDLKVLFHDLPSTASVPTRGPSGGTSRGGFRLPGPVWALLGLLVVVLAVRVAFALVAVLFAVLLPILLLVFVGAIAFKIGRGRRRRRTSWYDRL